jgi:hypothetical protein
MIETVKDGVELSSELLDDLFVAIRDKIPAGKWVPITKDHERVIAGIKYIIDCGCYGENFDVALHERMTHFKKIAGFEPMPKVFEGYYLSDHPASYWTEQDELALERKKREYLKAQKAEKHQQQRDRTYKKGRKKK